MSYVMVDVEADGPIPGDSSLDYSYGQDEAPELAPGLRVRHPIFGPGAVLAVMGTGPGQKLRIRFERAGVKTIVVRFANLELGYSTPPVGINLFIASQRFGRPILSLFRAAIPFLFLMLIWLALVTYIPAISLWWQD